MKTTAAVLMLFTAVSLSVAARAEDDEKTRLEKREVVITGEEMKGSGVPRVTVRALVKAPPEKIWAIIDKCENYKETMVRIKESKELWREGNKVRCEVLLSSPGPIKNLRARTIATHTVVPGKKWVREWTMEEGDYKVNNGSWTVTPYEALPGHSFVQYQAHSEPNIWVPGWLQEYAVKKGLPGLIEKLRSQTE